MDTGILGWCNSASAICMFWEKILIEISLGNEVDPVSNELSGLLALISRATLSVADHPFLDATVCHPVVASSARHRLHIEAKRSYLTLMDNVRLALTLKSIIVPYWRFVEVGISGETSGKNGTATKVRKTNGVLNVRTGISNGDKTVESNAPSTLKVKKGIRNGVLVGPKSGNIQVRAIIIAKKKIMERLFDKVEDQWFNLIDSICLRIYLQAHQ